MTKKNQRKLPTTQDTGMLKGKTILLRLGLNAAMKGNTVMGGYRIKQVIPTIKYLKEKGAKVIILGHIGRDPKQDIKPIADYINKRIKIGFIPSLKTPELKNIIKNMKEGTALMLQNVRSNPGEVANSDKFAQELASLADIYINDAFSVSHREHASIVGLPKFLPSFIGFQFEKELKYLGMARKPRRPFLLIIGGGKTETKIPLMKQFLPVADYVFLGGVPAHAFWKENGQEIGKSTADTHKFGLKAYLKNKKLYLPTDVIVKNRKKIKKLNEIDKNDVIQDMGPESVKVLEKLINKSKFIIWNGPFGEYEKGFDESTVEILKILAKSKATTIIGGGDTLTLAFQHKLHNKFSFVSTGGGAMLDYLVDGDLPGINAILKGKVK